MMGTHDCPLCNGAFEAETDVRVHLEVEHRKSELASHIVETGDALEDPVVEGETSPSTI